MAEVTIIVERLPVEVNYPKYKLILNGITEGNFSKSKVLRLIDHQMNKG